MPVCLSRNPSILPVRALGNDILKGCMQRDATTNAHGSHLVRDIDGQDLVCITLLLYLVDTYEVLQASQNPDVGLLVGGGCPCRNAGECRSGTLSDAALFAVGIASVIHEISSPAARAQ